MSKINKCEMSIGDKIYGRSHSGRTEKAEERKLQRRP